MIYSQTVTIHRSRDLVTRLFADASYQHIYQDGFVSKTFVRGEKGKKGAVSLLIYKMGKRDMELEETIVENNLPDSFEGLYRHEHMDNLMRCRFVAIDENTTRYDSEYEYTRISWVMPRLIAMLFPGMFKKPSQRWMDNFKEFVESFD